MPKGSPQKFMIGGLLYTLLFAGAAEEIGGADTDNRCGGKEKWKQKVMIDDAASSIRNTYLETTIEEVQKINTKINENKFSDNKARMRFESQIYKIRHCFITDVLREDDNDLHLVIEDGNKHHMIAEIPDTKCPEAARSDWSGQFEKARSTMLKYANNYRHHLFSVTGVLFLDKFHNQTGCGPNNIEVHPIIELREEKEIKPLLK